MRFEDLMELKNDTARSNAIRERIAKILYQTMVNEFGDEFVRLTDKKITVFESDIPPNTVLADVGDVLDSEKCTVGVVVELGVKVKSWNTVKKKNGGIRYAITLDDVDLAMNPED